MKTCSAALLILLLFCSGCNKPVASIPRWEYKTLVIYDDEMHSMKSNDRNSFSNVDIQRELKEHIASGEFSSEWEVCGCFLEPTKDPRLIVLLKKPSIF